MHPKTQAVEYQPLLFGEPALRLTPLPVVPKVKRESKPPARVYWLGPYRDSSHAYRSKEVDV
jgi:hypothetical protein